MAPPRNYKDELDRMLVEFGGFYTFEDLLERIADGRMQSWCYGETWVVTAVNVYPRRKVVNIVVVVGKFDEALEIEPDIIGFARDIGATLITAMGREGWWRHPKKASGWKRLGAHYHFEVD